MSAEIAFAVLYYVKYSPVFLSPGITDSVFFAVVVTEDDVSFTLDVKSVTFSATKSDSGKYGVKSKLKKFSTESGFSM